jgi:stage II sporulation protein D
MRRFVLYLLLAFLLVMVGVPFLSLRLYHGRPAGPLVDPSDQWPVTVYFPTTKEIRTLPLGEYLTGVVAAEVLPTFAQEAVKAQFVAARTYTLRRMRRFAPPGQQGCPLNPQAEICADASVSQAYKTKAQLVEQMGAAGAAAWWQRLKAARQETAGLVLRYQGALIDPLYHAVSGRLTEDAAAYYGTAYPYLKPVDDSWGAAAPRLYEERHFTVAELTRLLGQAVSVGGSSTRATRCTASGEVERLAEGGPSPVQIQTCTASGRVGAVQVASQTLSGREFRERLGLRSTDFQLAFQEGQLYVRTRGWGHGLGMSQWGANGMAQAGKKFREILAHYYPGTELNRIQS